MHPQPSLKHTEPDYFRPEMLIEQEISCDTWILRATKRKIHPKGRDAPVPTGANGVNHVRFADNPLGYQQNVTSLRQQPPWLLSQSEFCTCLVQNSGNNILKTKEAEK